MVRKGSHTGHRTLELSLFTFDGFVKFEEFDVKLPVHTK